MLTTVWNPGGFHSINVLENERKFSAMHYITERLSPLSDWCESDVQTNDRKLIVHADNSRPQGARFSTEFFEENRMKMASHPPYSPNIATSDFYLLEYVKIRLAGCTFADAEELFETVEGILDGIEKGLTGGVYRVDGPT
jgi:hypothetical protein